MTLIGATTENPSFEVNGALLSRARVYELSELTEAHVRTLLGRALERGECGDVRVDDDAVELLAARAGGDARTALAALELACRTAPEGVVTERHAEDALQRRILHYDRADDRHYDTISAWIKATRASDPDASLYYLAVMLEGGEDPRFIARRMVILASEDVGNADPQAVVVATACAAAVDRVGLPEAQFPLAQAAIYLSLAPKSDAAKRAIGAAKGHVRDNGAEPPPVQLRSGGRGEGYENAAPAARPPRRAGGDAAGRRRRALLRPGRAGGGADRAAGGDPPGARARAVSAYAAARSGAAAVPSRRCRRSL